MLPVSDFKYSAAPDQRGVVLEYLKRLLPDRKESDILSALAHSTKDDMSACITEVATRLGEQFFSVEMPLSEVANQATTLPALLLSDPPRVLLPKDERTLEVFSGSTSQRVSKSELDDEPVRLLVRSPKMTLACLRDQTPIRRMLAYLRTERDFLKALVIYGIFVEALSLGVPLAVQVLINTISFGMMTQQLIVLSAVLFIALAGAATLKVFQQILVEHLSRRFFARTVMDYSDRLRSIDGSTMKNPVHRFFEVASVDKSFFVLGLDLVALMLQLLAATLLLAVYHPSLLGYTLVMVLSAWLVVHLPFSHALHHSIEESHAKYELADFLQQGQEDDLEHLRLFTRWEDARQAGFRIAMRQQTGLFTIQVVLTVALLFLGGALVIAGQISLGQLVAAELVAGTALLSLGKLGRQLPKIYDLITSFEKLGTFVDLPLRGSDPESQRTPLSLSKKGAAG